MKTPIIKTQAQSTVLTTKSVPSDEYAILPTERGAGGATQAPPPDLRSVGSPRTVTRGESLLTPSKTAPANSAITDWLNCTFKLQYSQHKITEFCSFIGDFFGVKNLEIQDTGKGLHGWMRSYKLQDTNAMFAIGGQKGTALLSLPGEACALIANDEWPALIWFLRDVHSAKITRWDGAVDDYKGIHSVDWAVQQFRDGNFNTGGNRPSITQFGNWLTEDTKGRTFVVGQRKNGKMIRIYEKGKQLGQQDSPWVRWELELHNRDREIPWDVLINPGSYVAGAYGATDWIKEKACRIKTCKKTAQISYDALIRHASTAYGPLLNVMNEFEGSPEQVLKLLIREGIPKRLQIPKPPEMNQKQLPKD